MVITKEIVKESLQIDLGNSDIKDTDSLSSIGVNKIILLNLNCRLKKIDNAITVIDFSKAVIIEDIYTILEELGILGTEAIPEPINIDPDDFFP